MPEKTFYITTPIYYVNGNPHIGHAYTTILADVLKKYHTIMEEKTFFLTGTDEHGQKVGQAAEANGVTPEEYCGQLSNTFKSLWKKMKIDYDQFIRTTQPDHIKVVKSCLQKLYDKGDIHLTDYTGWYCTPCERFWTEKDLKEGKCPDCGRKVEELVEQNYYFRMSRYQDWLINHIQDHPDFIQPDFRKNEILGFLKKPLDDLCISRPKKRLQWGIPLPFDQDYVCYVWFDALINYITGAGYLSSSQPGRFKELWPADYHLIGKDILTTHAVYWPTMLKALELPQPKTILAHGWWLIDRDKMSKSKGNVVKPLELIDLYGNDEFRYFLIKNMVLGLDSNFSEQAMIDKINSDLANDLGNLVNRISKMSAKYLGSKIRKPRETDFTKLEQELFQNLEALLANAQPMIKSLKLNILLEETFQIIRGINKYLEQTAPWKLAKDHKIDQINLIMYSAAMALLKSAYIIYPVMPQKMSQLFEIFNLQINRNFSTFTRLNNLSNYEEIMVSDTQPLFPRIEKKIKLDSNEQLKSETNQQQKNLVSIDEFFKTELRTAKIIQAEKISKSKKLLKIQVEVGANQKQIVAGIAKSYQPEELVGKFVIIVDNLKPTKLCGEVSEGMILAVKTLDNNLSVISPEKSNVKSGEQVT